MEEKPLICDICQVVFNSMDVLRKRCQTCTRRFTPNHENSVQLRDSESETSHKSPHTRHHSRFDSEAMLLRYTKDCIQKTDRSIQTCTSVKTGPTKHLTQRRHICLVCFLVFDSKEMLTEHSGLCSEKNSKSLALTNKDSTSKNMGGRGHVCGNCCWEFGFEGAVKDHLLSCTATRNSKCSMETYTESKIHICCICDIMFNSLDLLATHSLMCKQESVVNHSSEAGTTMVGENNDHTEEIHLNIDMKPLVCHKCCEKFQSENSLNYHVLTCGDEKPEIPVKKNTLRSSICSARVDNFNEKPHICSTCYLVFHSEELLANHSEMCRERKPYICQLCHLAFKEEEELLSHDSKQHQEPTVNKKIKEKRHKCDKCNRAFHHKPDLTRHYRTHTGEKPFQCDQCERTFAHKPDLKRHYRTHTGEKPYQCVVCSKLFTFRTDLKRHMRVHSGEKPYKCDKCLKTFKQQAHLLKHSWIHTDERRFQCVLCDKSFRDNSDLKGHMRTHSGEKPYQCNLCEKSFALKTTLNNHMLTHSDARPHQCDLCGKSFKERTDLRKHGRVHSGEKPFKCERCDKAFSHSGNLTKHMKVHREVAGEAQKYDCDQCDRTFIRKSNLIDHKRSHTGERPFECEFCQRSYHKRRDLTKHYNKIHSGVTKATTGTASVTEAEDSVASHLSTSNQIEDVPSQDNAWVDLQTLPHIALNSLSSNRSEPEENGGDQSFSPGQSEPKEVTDRNSEQC